MRKPRYFEFKLRGRSFKVDGGGCGYLLAENKIWSGLGRHLSYNQELNKGSLYSRRDCHMDILWTWEYDSKEEFDSSSSPEITGKETEEQAVGMLNRPIF